MELCQALQPPGTLDSGSDARAMVAKSRAQNLQLRTGLMCVNSKKPSSLDSLTKQPNWQEEGQKAQEIQKTEAVSEQQPTDSIEAA
jgi:hypothetical protein